MENGNNLSIILNFFFILDIILELFYDFDFFFNQRFCEKTIDNIYYNI